jgi:hypothetical protein
LEGPIRKKSTTYREAKTLKQIAIERKEKLLEEQEETNKIFEDVIQKLRNKEK